MQRNGVNQSDLFSDKYVRRCSLPNQFLHPTSVTHHRDQTASCRRTGSPTSSHTSSSSYPSHPRHPPVPSNARSQTKRPSSASRCIPRSTIKTSQLRQQSLPLGLPKSRSAGTCMCSTATSSKPRNRSTSSTRNASKFTVRQDAAKPLSGPSLTNLYLRRGQRIWHQSIPSKSSPKQPLLEKRQVVVTSHKCGKRGDIQQRQSFSNCSVHDNRDVQGIYTATSVSRKVCSSSEVEITQVQFELDKPSRGGNTRSSISKTYSLDTEEIESRTLCQNTVGRDRKAHSRRLIEIHIPSSSSTYECSSFSDSSCHATCSSTNSVQCSSNDVSMRNHQSVTDENGRTRISYDKNCSPCKRKDAVSKRDTTSKMKQTASFTGGSGMSHHSVFMHGHI